MQEEKICTFIEDMITLAPTFKKNFLESLGAAHEKKLSNHQFYCLAIIYKQESVPMSVLARTLGISKQQLTRIVDELSNQDLVIRTINPRNRRVILARLSDEGKKRIAAFKEAAKAKAAELFSVFGEEELDAAINSLRVLGELFAKIQSAAKL
ncbi:MAG: MarR family transcriptional regulator [Clostridiales bacterium]|nr:MarR family transcriptional regulator [Clostridiales bacterium]